MRGDPNARASSIAALDRANPDQLSFCASQKYANQLAATRAGIVLLSPDLAEAKTAAPARVVVGKPQEAMLKLLPKLYRPPVAIPGVHPTATIGSGARLGDNVTIGPHVSVGEGAAVGDGSVLDHGCTVGERVTLGTQCHIYPGARIYRGAVIGNRVAIHANAVIASDGFGYVFAGGKHEKIPHVGRCVIEDDVEIGAGTTIDRGSIDDTVIGAGTKIDNLVMIAHNVRVGRLCLITAQVGIAGSARIEDGVVIGGQAGISGHHTIGKGARLAAQAGVFGDIPPGETWSGYPARPHRESLRAQAALFRLSGIMKRLEQLVGRESDKE